MKKCYQMFGDGRLALLMIHRQFETNVAKIVGTKIVGTRKVGDRCRAVSVPRGYRKVAEKLSLPPPRTVVICLS